MKKIITSLLFLSYTLVCLSQVGIKLNREYDYVGNEVNKAGLRVVGLYDSSRTLLLGCVDEYGNEVIKLQYSRIVLSGDRNYIVATKNKENEEDRIVSLSDIIEAESQRHPHEYWSPDIYYDAELFSENGEFLGGKWPLLKISPYTFKNHNCAIIRTNKGNYGIIDSKGKRLFQPVYDQIQWMDSINGQLALALNGTWGLIDSKGNEICPIKYSNIEKSKDKKYYAVCINDLWGLIDSNGKEVCPIKYSSIDGENGKMLVRSNEGKFSIIDIYNNKTLIPFGYFDEDLTMGFFNGKTVWCQSKKSKSPKKSLLSYTKLMSWDGTILRDLNYLKKKYGDRDRYVVDLGARRGFGVKWVSIYDTQTDQRFDYYYDDLGREYSDFNLAKAANDEIRKIDNVSIESLELASIIWHSSTEPVQDKDFNLVVSAQSQSDIQDVYLVVNGHTCRDLNIKKGSSRDMTFSKEIPLNEGSNTIKVCVCNSAGTTQEEKMVVYHPQAYGQASIEWLAFDPTSVKNERLLKFGIKSKSKIEDVTVTVNGSQARGVKTAESDKYQMVIEHPVRLVEGANRIVVSLRNGEGITTKERMEYYGDITPKPVFNNKRIALIIGNSNYSKPEMKLKNPQNDANDIAEKLSGLGFHVILKLDATLNEMNAALEEFELQASEYDVALFYFAGHGIQSQGENYLLPTNIDYLTEGNIGDRCIRAGQVINQMDATRCKLKIAVLDACRNDPLSRGWHRGAGSRGLSSMNSPDGTIIAFSTAPGYTASDGTGRNSPYTESFLEVLDRPNLDIEVFFKNVSALVQNKTGKAQVPWMSSSNIGTFYINPQ